MNTCRAICDLRIAIFDLPAWWLPRSHALGKRRRCDLGNLPKNRARVSGRTSTCLRADRPISFREVGPSLDVQRTERRFFEEISYVAPVSLVLSFERKYNQEEFEIFPRGNRENWRLEIILRGDRAISDFRFAGVFQ